MTSPAILRLATGMFISFAVTFLAFLPALSGAFLWDDVPNFLTNPHYRGLGWDNLLWMFTTFHLGPYQPLSWMSLGLDYILWGMDPGGYHLSNLVIHGINAALFFLLAYRLLRSAENSAGPMAGRMETNPPPEETLRLAAALVAALLFSVHPLRVESVAWITERRDLVSGLFFIVFLLAYLEADRRRGGSGEKTWRLAAVAAFALSLLGKATGVTAPLVLIVLDVYVLRRLPRNPRRWGHAEFNRVLAEKVPYLLLGLALGLLAVFGQKTTGALKGLSDVGIPERIGLTLCAVGFYLQKTLLPFGLSALYETPRDFGALLGRALLSLLVVIGLTGLFWAGRHRRPGVLAAWLAYLIIVFPVSGVARAGLQFAADRYTYLACMPLPALVAAGVLLAGRRNHRSAIVRFVPAAFGLLLAASLGMLTWNQSGVWKTPVTLWTQALGVDPDSQRAAMNLAAALLDERRLDEAIGVYRELLRRHPSYGEGRYNLGLNLVVLGRSEEAGVEFERLIRDFPGGPAGYYGMGILMWQLGRPGEARPYLEQTLRIDPGHALARQALTELDSGGN